MSSSGRHNCAKRGTHLDYICTHTLNFVGTLTGTKITCCGSAHVHMDNLPSSLRLMVMYKLSAEKGLQPVLTTEQPQELFIRV